MKPDLFIRWHLGLGDAIICNGLVRALAECREWKGVIVTAKHHNLSSVRDMFSDESRIAVVQGEDAAAERLATNRDDGGWPVLRLGMFASGFDRENWAQSFYTQAGVPYGDRWERFKVGDWGGQGSYTGGEYGVFHEGGSGGDAQIDHSRVPHDKLPFHQPIQIGNTTIWQWRDVLHGAAEVHCIDSSVACLVDHLQENGQRLVLHKYARNSVPPDYRRKWEVLT